MPRVTIAATQKILAANDDIAQELHQRLRARDIRAINLMSGPGAGKTSLLERSIERLQQHLGIGVIEGISRRARTRNALRL
ncbi:hypothetical protein [Ktedonospora formicarum]|uniref:Hydrogenase accessory protein HypB n=1 Tax=Ktedonospora formicarum TaxID=2778364 RepID=A0A8J3MRT0_9CHLR|nr:hypothetical protein [Ktedonospora formicarum]GHO42590.1 hypothetical protein KSX_07530 [Ktedonospora formicarum]